MSWSPMFVNWFVCTLFKLEFIQFYFYTADICFMTIILASTNLKDLLESTISRESILFATHIILNIVNIVCSLIFIAITPILNYQLHQIQNC